MPQLKADFIHNTLTTFASDPRVVGFLWNNNVATQLVNGVEVTNDWRFDANATSAEQFVSDLASRRFRTGMVALRPVTEPARRPRPRRRGTPPRRRGRRLTGPRVAATRHTPRG